MFEIVTFIWINPIQTTPRFHVVLPLNKAFPILLHEENIQFPFVQIRRRKIKFPGISLKGFQLRYPKGSGEQQESEYF